MLKKVIRTIGLATVLLTGSISANELATQGFSGSTAKVETIGAFDNIPTQNITNKELTIVGEGWKAEAWKKAKKWFREHKSEIKLSTLVDSFKINQAY